jgi:predicted nucleotidyltransferase
MERETVLKILRGQQEELAERFSVRSLALFGSVARNQSTPDSDVDLLVEFDRPVGLFQFIDLQQYLERLLGCTVDLGTPNSLKPRLKDHVLQEAIRVT